MIFDSIKVPDFWIDPHNSVVLTLNAGEIVISDAFSLGLTLRFPRITKVRIGADSKNPSDIESDRSLYDKFFKVQGDRSISSGSSDFKVGSPAGKVACQKCRFFTEKQYLELKKNKKSKKTLKALTGVSLPAEPEVMSAVLKGLTFSLLGKGFKIEEGSIDIEEARDQGWLDEAKLVNDSSAVITFIKRHGGIYKISADNGCTFVLGGSCEDPKVATHVRAIEIARSQTRDKRAKTKKGQQQERMAQSDGVLRWTYVYSLVHRWLADGHSYEEAIQSVKPEMLRPTILDYLARPNWVDTGILADPSLFESDLSTQSMMRRAVGLVERLKQQCLDKTQDDNATHRSSWRSECIERLEVDQLWVVACKRQALWPYSRYEEPHPRIVLYPDIFYDNNGLFSEGQVANETCEVLWNDDLSNLPSSSITSALPLARVMGAFVTPHLDDNVTHILCDLTEGPNEIVFDDDVTESIFFDGRRGRLLLDRLKTRVLRDHAILLISPGWLRKRKWLRDGITP